MISSIDRITVAAIDLAAYAEAINFDIDEEV